MRGLAFDTGQVILIRFPFSFYSHFILFYFIITFIYLLKLYFRLAIALVEYLNAKDFNTAFFVIVVVVSFVCLFFC